MATSLYVVIPTSRRLDLLRRTLESLTGCRKPSIYQETIVIENGPRAGAEDVLKDFRAELNAQYMYQTIGNKSHALNLVLKEINEGLIFFADDDVRFHPETLQAYSEAAIGVDEGQFYSGPTGVDYEQEPAPWLKQYLPPSARGLDLSDRQENRPNDLKPFLGFNWAAFAKDLKHQGGFNPIFGPGSRMWSTGQESDMHRRLFDHGIKQIYVPQAMVWHYVPRGRCSPRWIVQRAFRHGVHKGYNRGKRMQTVLKSQSFMWRKWGNLLGRLLRTIFSTESQARFDALYDFAQQSGRIHGFRKSRKTTLVPNPSDCQMANPACVDVVDHSVSDSQT